MRASNSYVESATGNTVLTYLPQVDPAPLSASITSDTSVVGSLEITISNQTTQPCTITLIEFALPMGSGAGSLGTTSAGTLTAITAASDATGWQFSGPSSVVTNGSAGYTLGPSSGTSVSLASGAYITVQIYEIPIATTPGVATVQITENVQASTPPNSGSFPVSVYPPGFYFDSLTANKSAGSGLVEVAQVKNGEKVTLTWNSSVVDTASTMIYYSDPKNGQRTASPTGPGTFTVPHFLVADTVFTVVVSVGGDGTDQMTASQTLTVSVQNPNVFANAINVGPVVNANQTGMLAAQQIIVTDALLGGNASMHLMAVARYQSLSAGTYTAPTDGFAIGIVNGSIGPAPSSAFITGSCGPVEMVASGGQAVNQVTNTTGTVAVGTTAVGTSFILPVPANKPFTLAVNQSAANATPAPTEFWWMPLGTGPATSA